MNGRRPNILSLEIRSLTKKNRVPYYYYYYYCSVGLCSVRMCVRACIVGKSARRERNVQPSAVRERARAYERISVYVCVCMYVCDNSSVDGLNSQQCRPAFSSPPPPPLTQSRGTAVSESGEK